MATGWTSMRFGWTAYVMPFLFVFSPSLLLQGDDNVALAMDVSTAVIGVWLVSSAMIGYFINALGVLLRSLAMVSGILLRIPQELATGFIWTDIVGAALAMVLFASEFINTRRRRALASG